MSPCSHLRIVAIFSLAILAATFSIAQEKEPAAKPATHTVPKDILIRKATRIVDLPKGYATIQPASSDKEIWIGDGFKGKKGYGYDSVKINAETGKIVQRVTVEEWKGGVDLLDNGMLDRAYCYHGSEGGHVTIRELATGRVIKKVPTPFHDGISFNDPLQVRNLGDIEMCGKDGRWIMAVTDDDALHSIDTESGKHRIEWKHEPLPGEDSFFSGHVIGLLESSKVVIQGIGGKGRHNAPLRIWDQATQTMTTPEKVPAYGWHRGWGDLAWNELYGGNLWNLATLQNIKLPLGEEDIEAMTSNRRQTTLFALRKNGVVDVLRITDGKTAKAIARLPAPSSDPMLSVDIVLSADDRFLFWQGRPSKLDKDGEPEDANREIIGIFDVADLTK